MRVPSRLRTATENSAQTLNDSDTVIQKVRKKSDASDKPPYYQIYELLNFDDAVKVHRGFINKKTNVRNASLPAVIWPVVRLVPNSPFDTDTSPDRLNQLLKTRYFHEDELPWQLPEPVTRRHSTYSVDSREPARRPKEPATYEGPDTQSTSALWLAAPLFSFFVVLLIGILLKKIIRCLRAPQEDTCRLRRQAGTRHLASDLHLAIRPPEQSEDNASVTLSVESEYSENSDNDSDSPPPYSECGVNDNSIVNKALDFTSEEPPPYSTCLGLLNTDDMVEVHKRHSVEGQPHIYLNDADTAGEHNGERNDSRNTPLNIVDTTTDLDLGDGVVDQNIPDNRNGNSQ